MNFRAIVLGVVFSLLSAAAQAAVIEFEAAYKGLPYHIKMLLKPKKTERHFSSDWISSHVEFGDLRYFVSYGGETVRGSFDDVTFAIVQYPPGTYSPVDYAYDIFTDTDLEFAFYLPSAKISRNHGIRLETSARLYTLDLELPLLPVYDINGALTISAVPIPASAPLVAGGLGLLLMTRKRNNRTGDAKKSTAVRHGHPAM